jgi:glutaconate CoA-transferase subunit B
LISDLGQFDFNGDDPEHSMRLISFHQGASIKRIQAKTGFDIEIAPNVQETPPPTEDELYLLRDEIDPLHIRRLELLSGNKRRKLLREIILYENSETQV